MTFRNAGILDGLARQIDVARILFLGEKREKEIWRD